MYKLNLIAIVAIVAAFAVSAFVGTEVFAQNSSSSGMSGGNMTGMNMTSMSGGNMTGMNMTSGSSNSSSSGQ
jgi:hypothetical protein